MRRPLVATTLLLGLAPLTAAAQQGDHLLVVGGLGGDAEYRTLFHEWATGLVDAARAAGIPDDNITYLAEKPERDPARIAGESRKEDVTAALAGIAETSGAGDRVFVVLIGHGSFRNGEARFNLPGPDLTAAEYGAALDALAGREVVFVNTASASGPFIEALSGPGRTIITATRTGTEQNQTRFGGYFVAALSEGAADVDKNGRVSVLEAYEYARIETERSYASANRLATEHSLLDDDGDGTGTGEAGEEGDGVRARGLYFGTGAATRLAEEAGDTTLVRLQREKAAIETEIQELRSLRDGLEPEAYQARLEELLLELAVIDRAIRARSEGR